MQKSFCPQRFVAQYVVTCLYYCQLQNFQRPYLQNELGKQLAAYIYFMKIFKIYRFLTSEFAQNVVTCLYYCQLQNFQRPYSQNLLSKCCSLANQIAAYIYLIKIFKIHRFLTSEFHSYTWNGNKNNKLVHQKTSDRLK